MTKASVQRKMKAYSPAVLLSASPSTIPFRSVYLLTEVVHSLFACYAAVAPTHIIPHTRTQTHTHSLTLRQPHTHTHSNTRRRTHSHTNADTHKHINADTQTHTNRH